MSLSIPPPVKAKAEERKVTPIPAPTPTVTDLRETLRLDYERFMAETNPHLNYIKARVRKGPADGVTLQAVHTYFGRYSFDIGPTAKEVTAWINAHQADLDRAKVHRVGVAAAGEFGGETWFDLRPKDRR